ncbi:urea ABC transporter permease subunit UrtB [Oricola thermophila]|uniref:Urea ABC transporter permease subunit UrtB n=1 Tax=Oricola thermophila TaxID=2742145 RepID=A0A6N1VD93_9HYPH|nr:urea ABC transporter permease subunit UrtB [Oricola thermophila]QKV17565.1 urea ABC transporter permease subunit UrtB [Oricola thermophila]
MRLIHLLTGLLALLLAASGPVHADDAALRETIAKFAEAKKFKDTEAIVEEIAGLGDPAAAPALDALSRGLLQVRESDGAVFVVRGSDLLDPVSLEPAGIAGEGLRKVKIKNSIRRQIADAISGLTLRANDPAVRMQAAETLFSRPDPDMIETLDAVIAGEAVADVRTAFVEARAAAVLQSDLPEADRLEAVAVLRDRGGRDVLAVLAAAADGEDAVAKAAASAVAAVEKSLAFWSAGQNVWYGISLGSVLLLAAIGLAITFGVMGVINMAHGEMVMLGAYTTFVVQEFIRTSAPGLFDWSLAIALPLAFLVSGTAGLVMERGIIRYLYGRPLETLLATWGVSLILQQAVRSVFGPTNREVGNPSWMSGSFEVGEMLITTNRLWIVVFSLVVFAILLVVLKRTRFGLQMRAVTQNRAMASSMGIATPWVDAFTFALGSGIAGIAGVALSQIDNVSPNLGQGYIIDSFMVVVFGGVGNLWGTLVGALTLGVANKFLEPYAGAVLAKILILVFIILFIQKRPRGLFALKGRSVEA